MKIGQKVLINIEYMHKNIPGTYQGLARRKPLLRVRRDGIKSIEYYHPSFIKPAPSESGGE